MNTKLKIYIALAAWLVLTAAMFGYGFTVLDEPNRQMVAKINDEKRQVDELQAKQDSFRRAQKDLSDLAAKQYQPADFFSEDVTLVKELEELENLGKSTGVTLTLGGISGTIKTIPKAKTKSELYVVPYSMGITGQLDQVVNFIESLENMDFVTTLSSLNLTGQGNGAVNVSMTANLYIRNRP